jgi:hypothetical protein
MGGQACVFYGAAEFSRDLDLLILPDPENLALLRAALDEMAAEPIAVPPLDESRLRQGHAVHFRCRREDVAGLRIDLMSTLRGVDDFEALWERRTTIETDGVVVDMLGLEDLVRAKKTQRDKDWPMIRRLVEESYFRGTGTPGLWLRELRTPELLIEVAREHREVARAVATQRPAVGAAREGDAALVASALAAEESEERRRDRIWWQPLRAELERLRPPKRDY